MNYQVALKDIADRRAELDREQDSVIMSAVQHSKCFGCCWMSNPRQGVIPTCRDVDNANYSRRIPEVTACKSHWHLKRSRLRSVHASG